jgi:hypothetical protein
LPNQENMGAAHQGPVGQGIKYFTV